MFLRLLKNGTAHRVHDFYADVVSHFKPKELYVSGGEPLLLPGIGKLISRMAVNVERIHLFTSYQFTAPSARKLDLEGMPWDKVVLTHTVLYFRKEPWEEMTRQFPFDLYLDNLRTMAKLPWRKCYKFIVNHPDSQDELERFIEAAGPDSSTTIRWKLMNQQAGIRFNQKAIEQTREQVLDRINRWQPLVTRLKQGSDNGPLMDQSLTGLAVLQGLSSTHSVESCPYLHEPEELRFAFYRAKGKKLQLKYRFCPHFPSDFHYLHEVETDPVERIAERFTQKEYTRHCNRCRLRLYVAQ